MKRFDLDFQHIFARVGSRLAVPAESF